MRIFTGKEEFFRCPCNVCKKDPDRPSVAPLVVTGLNALVQHLLSDHGYDTFNVSSGRRCEGHNKAVGGAPGSTHVLGLGVDIPIEDSSFAYGLVDAAMVNNVPFIELCEHHVHLDWRVLQSNKLIWGKAG